MPAGQKTSEASAHHSFSLVAFTIAIAIPTSRRRPAPAHTQSSTESARVAQALKPTSRTPAAQPAMIIASIDLRPSFSQ